MGRRIVVRGAAWRRRAYVDLGEGERGHPGTVTLVASLGSLAEDVQVTEGEIADEPDCKANLGQNAVPSQSPPDGVAMVGVHERRRGRCISTYTKCSWARWRGRRIAAVGGREAWRLGKGG